jgi:hypothetical protein
VNYIFSGTIQKNAKRMNTRRLQKTSELNRSGLQEIKHLEGTRSSHAKAEPSRGPAQADRPCGEADQAPPVPDQATSGKFLHRLLGLI